MLLRNCVFSLVLFVLLTFTVFFMLSNKAYAEEEYIEYKVLQNDTLTKVLKRHSLKPIYGRSGSLAEALKLNPKKQNTHGDLILIGEILLLPKNMSQVNLTDSHNPSQVNVKKEKPKVNLTPNEEIKKEQNPKTKNQEHKNPEPKKQPPVSKAPEITKETASQIKIMEKIPPKKREPDLNKNVEQKNVFIPNKQKSPEKETTFNPNNQNNKSNSQTEYLTFTKTQLPALPLKQNNAPAAKETIVIQKQETYSNSEMEYDFLLDTSNLCNPNPSCRSWLWEPESKCCKPIKKYFLFFERDSL
jgi:hypothetical protein